MFDTILFDLDDTLIKEAESAQESVFETINKLDAGINKTEFLNILHQQARELWYNSPVIDFFRHFGISSLEALWADFTGDGPELTKLREFSGEYRFNTWSRALHRFNIMDPAVAERACTEYKNIRNSKHNLFPETTGTLTVLTERYKLGLITNGAPDLQWKKIDGGNLRHFFGYIAISGECGYAKPDKRLFDSVLRGLKSLPSNTIMVGNNLQTDIKGAQDYGILTIWVDRDGNSLTDNIIPDYKISNLSEVIEIVGTI